MTPNMEKFRGHPRIRISENDMSCESATNPQESEMHIVEGDENIQERLSDLYSTARNVSVREPKVMSKVTRYGVTQSRHFSS